MPITADFQASSSIPAPPSLGSGLPPYGLAMRFTVQVDGLSLGQWSACKGLKVEFKVTKLSSGGDYTTDHLLPDRISYSNITLQRAMHSTDSAAVMQWLQQVAADWYDDYGSTAADAGRTATITLYDVNGNQVFTWTLNNVYPISWKGPDLSGSDNNVAIEELVLAHEGFLTP
jgi:phage tail-like protein